MASNYASVYGMQKGTNLHGDDYSWLSSIFYFGYMAGQYPGAILMQKLPTGKFSSSTVLCWACHNFAGMAANIFLLGFVEAAINPGFVILMGMCYKSSEQPLRLESYYCTNGIATMFGGLIGYAIGHINSGLPKWMYVFIIFGALSFSAGILSMIVLPDLPSTAKFLTERERFVAVDRVSKNKQGVKNRRFSRHQAWQTVADPKTWILFVMAVGAQIPNSALTSFTSLIIKSFGSGTLGTQYLQIPGGAQGLGFSMSLTTISSNVAGYTKKQLTGTILFTGYCVGNIIGPQTFKSSERDFHSAYIAMLVGYSIKLACVVILYIYMYLVNKKRDREAATAGTLSDEEERAAIEQGMHDVTALDNKGFRYAL
ncbi:hypothetical protein TI39_contig685g00004 [Zymoseptoria brevis]|uniref:Allantoate permease like protein n=1 Tax=Zymoseptoria brevis TaxID=1047168 RepID=A0A0F4GFQ1_9PEZI|nr:hypothetical protein TI39_contig685g00004 [Zymoseptoria brevis]